MCRNQKTVGSRTMLGPHGFGSKVELQQQVEAKLERWRSGEVENQQAKVEKEERCSFQLPQGLCTTIIFLSVLNSLIGKISIEDGLSNSILPLESKFRLSKTVGS